MLILEKSQIECCQIQSIGNDKSPVLNGIRYNGKLFRPIDRYSLAERDLAIRNARQLFIDTHGKRSQVVVAESDGLSVWEEDKSLQTVTPVLRQPYLDLVQDLDLKTLVGALRNVGGIDICDRRYHLKIYSRCFIGSEAVDWFVDNLGIDRPAAIVLGQRLIDEHWIHHVVDQHTFADGHLFYRFYWDEARS
jgi:Domain found in Dishevelled, Egl-10, and Pleckstrin (DEP)